jgi:hypothetical protein
MGDTSTSPSWTWPHHEAPKAAYGIGLQEFARRHMPKSHDDGIDTARVDRFLISLGIPATPAYLLTRPEVKALRDELSTIGYKDPMLDQLALPGGGEFCIFGTYLQAIDAVIVVRNHLMEQTNTVAYTEAFLANMKAYATTTVDQAVYAANGTSFTVWYPRKGFLTTRRTGPGIDQLRHEGCFLEEGFAQMVASEYVCQVLHMPIGVWNMQRPPNVPDLPEVEALMLRDIWRGETEHSVCFLNGAIAAEGLRLIIDMHPDLYFHLLLARTNAAALNDVAAIIESVQPGLCRTLVGLQYGRAGFLEGLARIQHAVGYGGSAK